MFGSKFTLSGVWQKKVWQMNRSIRRLLIINTNLDTEGFADASTTPNPIPTPKEKYLWGLLKGREYGRGNVEIKIVEERGCSAFAANHSRQETSYVSTVEL